MKEYKGFKIPDEEAEACGVNVKCMGLQCYNCIFGQDASERGLLTEYLAIKNNKPKVINYEIY